MTRPMSEEREKLLERAREIVADDLSAMTASWTDTQAFARALLSTSSAERGMREALESIRYHSENQDMSHLTFRIKARECVDHALSSKGEG